MCFSFNLFVRDVLRVAFPWGTGRKAERRTLYQPGWPTFWPTSKGRPKGRQKGRKKWRLPW